MTVSKVLTELAQSKLIERRRKSGSFVLRPPGPSAVLEIQDIKGEVLALGLPYRHEIVARRRRRIRRKTDFLPTGPQPVKVASPAVGE